MDRYGETWADGAPGARIGHARPRGDSLDSGEHEGRVEKIIVWPGTNVEPDTVILELTSPELEQAAHDAESKATQPKRN